MFPRWVWIKETHADGGSFWKVLCIVFDNEALGIIERALSGCELKTEYLHENRPGSNQGEKDGNRQ